MCDIRRYRTVVSQCVRLSFEQHLKDKVVPNVQAARAQLYPYNATSEGLDISTCATLVRSIVESQIRYGAPIWAPGPGDNGKWVRKWSTNATAIAKVVKAHTTAVGRYLILQ